MDVDAWSPKKLLKTSGSYWQACTLHAAVELDLFSVIEDDALTGEQIAAKLATDERATTMLLNALVAMSLLEKQGGVYANTSFAKEYLIKNASEYLGHIICLHHYLVDSWSKLDQAVKTGQPLRSSDFYDDEVRQEAYLMGMLNNAMTIAPRILDALDLSGRRRLLDLGGGPGAYVIQFCMRYPELKATVCDLATARQFAEETISRYGLSDRIEFVELDYLSQQVPGTFDAAWLSFILHAEGPQVCGMIIKKALTALEPGGLIAIHEFFLDNTMDGPLRPTLFSLNMLLGTAAGQSYSRAQISAMLSESGVEQIRGLSFREPIDSAVLVGQKPGRI